MAPCVIVGAIYGLTVAAAALLLGPVVGLDDAAPIYLSLRYCLDRVALLRRRPFRRGGWSVLGVSSLDLFLLLIGCGRLPQGLGACWLGPIG